MTIGCIIQARMGSSRLPGKVMMKVDETNPVLYYVISQLRESSLIDKMVVATTDLKEDDLIENFLKIMNVECFRGSSLNVLDRYYNCARKFSFSTIVRITADNPLIDPIIVDELIEKFSSNSYDFVTNCLKRTFPYGTEVEVFSFKALERAWSDANTPHEKEHVTPHFYNNPEKFKIFNVEYHDNLSNLRWTVDKMEDLELVRKLATEIKERPILMNRIIEFLTKK